MQPEPALLQQVSNCVQIMQTRTLVGVRWADGTTTTNIEAKTLRDLLHLGSHDFFPQDLVVEDNDDESSNVPLREGTVLSSDMQQRTCMVQWKLGEEGVPELHSAYELRHHPMDTCRLEDVVLRMPSCHGGESHQGWVGYVMGHEAGQVRVAWQDGAESLERPDVLSVLDAEEKDGDLDASIGDSESDDGSWCTVEEGEEQIAEAQVTAQPQPTPAMLKEGSGEEANAPEDSSDSEEDEEQVVV